MIYRKQSSLGRRISVSFILLITITFVLVLMITSYSTFHILNREYASRLTQELDGLTDSLDLTINDIYKINESIQNDARLKTEIRKWYDTPGSFATDHLSRVRSLSTLFSCVYLYNSDASLISRFDNIRRTDSFLADLKSEVFLFSQMKAYRSFVTVEGSIFYLCSLYETDYRYNAYLALEINQNRLFFRCFQRAKSQFPDIHITDGQEWVKELGEPLKAFPAEIAGSASARRGNRSYLVFTSVSRSYPAWTVVGLYDRTILIHDIMHQIFPLLIIFFVKILAVILISLLISRRITRPIEKLSGSMQLVEQGQYPPPLYVERHDEVGTLVDGYNHMIQALQQLHQNLLDEQNEKRQMEVSSLNMRMQLLQSQINPHFIYNTLNTMNYLAQEAGNDELSQLIYSFTSLLRSSISIDSDFVPVHTEIDSVKYYLQIQSYRYADIRIHCVYAIDPSAENVLLPRMILQPLAENALIHGILPSGREEGTIRIRCSVRDTFLHVNISDTGVGIPPEKLEKLRTGELKVSNGYNHIGLNNVRERLEILYKQDCGFQILSEEGRGTVISFKVPAMN